MVSAIVMTSACIEMLRYDEEITELPLHVKSAPAQQWVSSELCTRSKWKNRIQDTCRLKTAKKENKAKQLLNCGLVERAGTNE